MNRNTALVTVSVLCIALFFVTTHDVFAHMSFEFKPGANVNNTVRVVFGETKEPAYADEEHNLEMTLTHKMTQLRVGNAHKAQTTILGGATPATILFVDTYFYPVSTLVNGGVPVMTCQNASPDPQDCVPAAGYTDTRFAQPITTISANDGGTLGQYRQNTRQFYTENGLTLYNLYGRINYYNDTTIGTIPIHVWFDGKNTKRASVCEGLAANTAACITGDTMYNKTYVPSSSFGLGNKTDIYWPDTATENTHPTNLRKAIGTVRDNTWDIWNFLRDMGQAINTLNPVPTNPISDYPPKNFTNPN